MDSRLADVLLKILAVVDAGFELSDIVDEAIRMKANGQTDEEVSQWLEEIRKDALAQL